MKNSLFLKKIASSLLVIACCTCGTGQSFAATSYKSYNVEENTDKVEINTDFAYAEDSKTEDLYFKGIVIGNGQNSITLKELEATISVSLTESSADSTWYDSFVYGLNLTDGSTLETVTDTSSITMKATNTTNGGDVYIFGVMNDGGTLGTLAADVTVNTSDDDRSIGVYTTATASANSSSYIGAITGDILVTGDESSEAVGVYVAGNEKPNSNSYKSDVGSSSIGEITGNITVQTTTTSTSDTFDALGITVKNSGSIDKVDSVINVVSYSDNATGISLSTNSSSSTGANINSIDGALYVTKEGKSGDATGMNFGNFSTVGSIGTNTDGGMIINVVNNSTGGKGNAQGIYNQSTIGAINAQITVTSNSSTSDFSNMNIGVYNHNSTNPVFSTARAATIESLAGSITVTCTAEEAWGLYNYSYVALAPVDQDYLIGQVSADIDVTANGDAYGVYNKTASVDTSTVASIESLTGTITATSTSASGASTGTTAYGVYNEAGLIGSISAKITASSTSGDAYGIYTSSTTNTSNPNTITFADGASVTASTNGTDAKAYAIYSADNSLTLEANSVDAAIALSGDIQVNSSGTGTLAIDSGNYTLSSGQIAASSVTISENASLALTVSGNQFMSDSSSITVNNSGTVYLTAAADLAAGSYTLSNNSSLSIDNVISYGGTYDGNTFTLKTVDTTNFYVNDSNGTSISVTENSRLVLNSETPSTSALVMMDFDITGQSAETITVNSVTSISGENFEDNLISSGVDTSVYSSIELLAGYSFDVTGVNDTDSSVNLSFYVGDEDVDVNDIAIFHVDSEGKLTDVSDSVENLTYTDGYVSFVVDGFSGYVAASAAFNDTSSDGVPEPSTVTLSFLALTSLLARRRRKA